MPENKIQQYYDKLTSIQPHGTSYYGNRYIDEPITAASNFGAGVIGLANPIFHPIETGNAITHPERTLEGIAHSFREHPLETSEQALGGLVGGYGLGEAAQPLRAIKPFSESHLPSAPGSINLRAFVPPVVDVPPPRIPRIPPVEGEAPRLVPPPSDWKNPYLTQRHQVKSRWASPCSLNSRPSLYISPKPFQTKVPTALLNLSFLRSRLFLYTGPKHQHQHPNYPVVGLPPVRKR